MSANNHDMRLPSGAMTTVQTEPAPRTYYVWSGNGHLARLTVADVEALYADSIASDGGRELHLSRARARLCVESCSNPPTPGYLVCARHGGGSDGHE